MNVGVLDVDINSNFILLQTNNTSNRQKKRTSNIKRTNHLGTTLKSRCCIQRDNSTNSTLEKINAFIDNLKAHSTFIDTTTTASGMTKNDVAKENNDNDNNNEINDSQSSTNDGVSSITSNNSNSNNNSKDNNSNGCQSNSNTNPTRFNDNQSPQELDGAPDETGVSKFQYIEINFSLDLVPSKEIPPTLHNFMSEAICP